jgi:two-component sensor histidine kinase
MPSSHTQDRFEKALSRSLHRQGVLARFGTRALTATDLDGLLQQAAEDVAAAVDAPYIKVLEYRPVTNDFLMRAGVGWKPGTVGHATTPVGLRSPCGRAFLTSEPVRISDLRQSLEFDSSSLLDEYGIISLVNVPIAWDGHGYGVLEIDSSTFTDFLDETIHFLQGFANILAAAIQRKQQEEQREALFHELQHRIKNNLQMITSILSLEEQKGEVGGFRRSKEAVQAIALAYDQLQTGDDIETVCLNKYLGSLCRHFTTALGRSNAVALDCRTVPMPFRFNAAVVVGLIANELMTNAVKHAFGEAGGTIVVSLRQEGEDGVLVIEDDGRGMPAGTPPTGTGSRLLPALARQIAGQLIHDTEHRDGTRHILRFPLGWNGA